VAWFFFAGGSIHALKRKNDVLPSKTATTEITSLPKSTTRPVFLEDPEAQTLNAASGIR